MAEQVSLNKRVWAVVKGIPSGKVSTYKIVAEKLDTTAYRAVGSALNKNCCLDVPCHRVVNSSGKIGGFVYGSKNKKRLLQKEGIQFDGDKIYEFSKVLYKFK